MAEGTGDAERLVVLLEARIRDFEKNMAKASGTATKSYGGMRKDSRTATQQMQGDMNRTTGAINRAVSATSTKLGSLGKSIIAGFAGGLIAGGIAGIVTRVGQLAGEVASVGDEARRAGLSFKAFQELKYVAEQNRIGVDALTDGMKELALRADEFIVTGGGSAKEAFERLGYSAEELNTKLQDPSKLFTEIIGKLGDLDRAAQIRIADELFGGTGGEKFVQLISQGEEGIRRTIDEANDLGIVMSDEVIAKAAEVDRKFNQIANTISTNVRSAVVDLTFAMVDFLKAQDEAIRRNRLMAMDADAQSQYRQTMAEIEDFLDATGRVAPEAEAKVRDLVDAVVKGQMQASEANAELRAMGALNQEFIPISTSLTGLLSLLDLLVGRSQTARLELASLTTDPIGPGATWEQMEGFGKPAKPTKPGGGGGGKPPRDRAAEEAERQAKAVRDLIAGLEFERSLIGLSALEQEKLTTLRQAGAAATDEQRRQIEFLVEATHREQEAFDLMTERMDEFRNVAKDALQGLAQDLMSGKDATEALSNALSNMASKLISSGLDSLFSGIFGGSNFGMPKTPTGFFPGLTGPSLPSFDGGGGTGAGPRSGGVDDRGGFLALLHPQETVVDHTKGGSAAQGDVHVPINIQIDATGADAAQLLRLRQQIAQLQSELPGQVKQIVRTRGTKWR